MKNATFPEKALSFLALFTLFAVPLALFPGRLFPFIASKSFFFMGLAELTFFIWAYLSVIDERYRLSKKQILVFLIPVAFLISLVVSALFSPIPNLAFWGSFERATGVIFWTHCLAFGVVVAALVRARGKEYLHSIYKAVFYSGIVVALSTFINEHFINIPSLFLFDGPNSADLFGNSSFSAAYLIFALFIGAIIFFEKKETKHRFWTAVGLAIIIIAPIADHARGALGGILVGAIVAFFVWLAASAKKSIRIVGVSLLSIMFVGSVFVGASIMKLDSKLHTGFVEAATNSRFIFWKAAVEGIKERPGFGWGNENFNVVFSKYFDPEILEPGSTFEIWTDKPHNAFLEVLVSGGFVGGTLYLLFVLALFGLPIYLYKKNILGKVPMVMFEGLFVAYFLQDLILFDTIPGLMMLFALFGLFVGSIASASVSNNKNSATDTIKSLSAIICLGCFVASWIFFVHQPLRKSKGIISSLHDATNRQEHFAKLVMVSPMGNGGDVGFIASTMASSYRKNIAQIRKDGALVKSTHDEIYAFLDTVDTLENVAANSARLWLTSADLLNLDMTITNETNAEKVDRSLKYIDRAKALSPNNPRVYWTYGQLYLNVDEFAKAREAYQKAYDINPKVIRSQEYLKKFDEFFGSKLK
jgi:O-antigen ligase